MKLEEVKKNTNLTVKGEKLVFINGVCVVKKITKEIQHFIDVGYIKIIEGETNGKANNS